MKTLSSCLVLAACNASCNNDGDGQDSDPAPGVEVREHGAQVCADTGRSTAVFDRRESATPAMSDEWIWGGGITAADLDGDGWLEVLVALEQGLELYKGVPYGDTYEELGQTVFAGMVLTYGSGTSVADYDADGDLDIYVMRVMPGTTGNPDPPDAGLGENRLLRNDGNLTFVDVTMEVGDVSACGPHHFTGIVSCYRTMASSWGDYDLDGDLDLYVGNYGYVDETDGTVSADMDDGEPDFLYRNDGGMFTHLPDEIPAEVDEGYTYTGGFYDLDADNDLDLYVINDFGTDERTNSVMWNEGGTLVYDELDTSNLQQSQTGMGLGIGDLDGDRWLDLAIPEWKKNTLLMSNVELRLWIDEADADGFTVDLDAGQWVGWGTELGDVDNDGDQDIVSQYGYVANDNEERWYNPVDQPDGLYIATPDGAGGYTYVDEAKVWGVNDPFMNRGAVLADLDRDGWLDIGKRDLEGENVLYVSECGQEGWLVVHLRQNPTSMNTYAIGAKVEIEVADQTMVRHLFAGGTGYASSPPPEAHFGVGLNDRVDVVRVIWPDGREDEVLDIESRQQVTITRL